MINSIGNKVAFVVTNKNEVNFSSYNNQELGRAKALLNKGYSIDIYVYSKQKTERELLEKEGSNYIYLHYYKGIKFFGNQTIPINLISLLKNHTYHTVFLHEYPWILPYLVAKFYSGTKTKVVLMQGMYEDFNSNVKKIYNRVFDLFLGKKFIKKLSGIVFKTKGAQDYFAKKGYNIVPNVVIPVGLDTSRFSHWTHPDIENSIKKKILSSGFKILYVGVLEERRNPFFLLNLLEKLIKYDKNYLLLVIGNGPLLLDFKNDVEVRGLQDNIVHIDNVKQGNLPWFYRESDVLVLPSSYEIFGMVLLEALYFKLSFISTPTAGAKEIYIDDEKTSICELDVDEWYKRITELKNNIKIKKDSSETIPTRFDWNHIVKDTMEFVSQLKIKG